MTEKNFPDIVKDIHAEDNKYGKGAYFFVREALDHTLKSRNSSQNKKNGHVSGEELLEGIRIYALDRFGPMTMTLLNHWNINQCKDFGEIVFKLIDHGILGRTEMITFRLWVDIHSMRYSNHLLLTTRIE